MQENPFWNQTQHDRYAEVMDAFVEFDNVLGFFVGNEIISKANHSTAAPFIKSAARDMKAHRDAKGYRKVPIGYSAADIAELRPMLQDYLTCGGNASENVDFFGLNSYSWCDVTTYEVSGYNHLQRQAADFPVPIFFSETGCNQPGPRLFDDQQAIFGKDMVSDWSGAIIYEWIEEVNHYGLVSYGPRVPAPDPTATAAAAVAGAQDVFDSFTRKGTPTPVSPDFDNLKAQWAKVTPSGVSRDDYDPGSVSTRACPTSTADGWLVDGNVRLPSLGETFKGSFSTAPTAAASSATAAPSSTNNPASANREIAGMSAGLVGVMLFFTLWL